ncbi:MAG: Bax inhibitor-1/YccA family protein [Legionellales bacterium]|nr:Bax inhibitor-1/YccA family protein [Legionellales bacterium]
MNKYNITTLPSSDVVVKNKVLKNTYLLLSMTLIFSSITAYVSMLMNVTHPNILVMLVGVYGLMYLVHAFKDSALGIGAVFLFTGFLGYTLAPLLNFILEFENGGNIITMSLFSTGVIFFGLSGHALTSKKDYSYLGGMLFVGIITLMLASFGAMLFNIPALHLAVSSGFVLISSGMILFKTSQIINGGERNYLLATISLYVSLYNLFVSLLQIFAALSGRRN